MAFCVGRRDLTARIIDPIAEVGGQLTALYPDEFSYDIAGFPKICAKEPVQSLVEQLKPSCPSYILEHAEWLEPLDEDVFALTTSSGRTFPTRAVIVTAGVGARSNRSASRPRGSVARTQGAGVHHG